MATSGNYHVKNGKNGVNSVKTGSSSGKKEENLKGLEDIDEEDIVNDVLGHPTNKPNYLTASAFFSSLILLRQERSLTLCSPEEKKAKNKCISPSSSAINAIDSTQVHTSPVKRNKKSKGNSSARKISPKTTSSQVVLKKKTVKDQKAETISQQEMIRNCMIMITEMWKATAEKACNEHCFNGFSELYLENGEKRLKAFEDFHAKNAIMVKEVLEKMKCKYEHTAEWIYLVRNEDRIQFSSEEIRQNAEETIKDRGQESTANPLKLAKAAKPSLSSVNQALSIGSTSYADMKTVDSNPSIKETEEMEDRYSFYEDLNNIVTVIKGRKLSHEYLKLIDQHLCFLYCLFCTVAAELYFGVATNENVGRFCPAEIISSICNSFLLIYLSTFQSREIQEYDPYHQLFKETDKLIQDIKHMAAIPVNHSRLSLENANMLEAVFGIFIFFWEYITMRRANNMKEKLYLFKQDMNSILTSDLRNYTDIVRKWKQYFISFRDTVFTTNLLN